MEKGLTVMSTENGTRLALSDVQGPLVDLLERLDGRDGELWLKWLKKFLRKENPWEKHKVFKTIKIGTFRHTKTLIEALTVSSNKIHRLAAEALEVIELSELKQSVDLSVLLVEELGFKGYLTVSLKDIYKAAKRRGFDLCPAEVGPQLRLQYPDQPYLDCLNIAMEPLHMPSGGHFLFKVSNDSGGRWLEMRSGNPDDTFCVLERFVFVRRN